MAATNSPLRVWVTRPQPQAQRTAARLQAMGHAPLLLPIGETHATPPADWPRAEQVNALLITSPRALEVLAAHAPAEIRAAYQGLPMHCVGAATAQLALAEGFAHAHSAGVDVEGLLAYLRTLPAPQQFLYFSGEDTRTDLAAALAAQGHACHTHAIYRVAYRNDFSADEHAEITACRAVLVYSVNAARALVQAMAHQSLPALHAMCLSAAVAEALRPLGWPCHTSPTPTENDLLQMLDEWAKNA